jgi:hypothetical protein
MTLEAKKRELLDEGCCVVPGVLTAAETGRVRERLWAAAKENERLGVPTRFSPSCSSPPLGGEAG